MNTIYTAIFGPYDDLKEPQVITPGWRYICFTDQPLKSNVWQVVHREMFPEGTQRTARYYKIMFHRHIESEFSIWIDASFVINCNLDEWWKRFKKPMTCVTHPIRDCVYKEAQACIDQHRDAMLVSRQVENYRTFGLPERNGLISSGIIMRELCQPAIDICDIWYQQLQLYSVRDQIAFAYAAWRMPVHNLTEYNYCTGTDFLYLYHLHSAKREACINQLKKQNLLK